MYILAHKILLQFQTHWKKFIKFLKKKKKEVLNDLKSLFLKQKKIIKKAKAGGKFYLEVIVNDGNKRIKVGKEFDLVE